jgi:hypothetical protein
MLILRYALAGGGLCQPAIPGQLTLIGDGYATLQRNSQDVSIALVAYGEFYLETPFADRLRA